jgi:CBS domain-containing protein
MLAADIAAKDIVSVESDTLISDALALMQKRDVRHLLVIDKERLSGVLSNRDYRRVLYRADREGTIRGVNSITVKEIMTPASAVITAHADTPLLNIAQLIVMKKVGCIPVMDPQGRVIGLLTQKDVMEHLSRPRLPKITD